MTQTAAFGGTEVHTGGLIEILRSLGHGVDLIQCGHTEYERLFHARRNDAGLRLSNRDLRLDCNLNEARAWTKTFADVDGDVVVLPIGSHYLPSLWFLRACRRRFRSVYVIEHLEASPARRYRLRGVPGTVYGPRTLVERHRERRRAAYVDLTIAVSEAVRSRLVSDYDHPAHKVVVVRNGVAPDAYRRDSARGDAFRAHLGISPDVFVYGMLTRLDPVKGIDIALEALGLLIVSHLPKEVALVVAGEGPELAVLQRRAAELSLEHRAIFSGFVETPLDALSAFDAIVFSSRREGLPLGLLEAMAAGCAPIVTRVGGMSEVVDRAALGWVVAPDSADELRAAMRSALDLNQAEFGAIRQAASRRVREAFDVAETYARLLVAMDISSDVEGDASDVDGIISP